MHKKPIQVFNFTITNAGENTVDIHIDGDIVDASTQEILKNWYGDDTSVSFRSFRNQLDKSGADVYNVFINSAGGHVADAMAIHDLLVDLQGKGKVVNTEGRGLVASAATYILMAGKNARMSKNSWFMIHNVGGGVWGDVNMIENYANTLRKFNDSVRDFYSNATGKRKEEITKLMNAETWFTAEEAKNSGFVKEVTGDVNFTNSINKEDWNFSNLSVLNSYNAAVKPPASNQTEEMKKLFADLGTSILNAIKGVTPQAPKEGEAIDQSALVNSIAEAMQKPITDMGETMETTVNDLVNTAVTAAVKTAVEEAVKPLNIKIGELEKANEDLTEDVAKNLGTGTKDENKDAIPVIGAFN